MTAKFQAELEVKFLKCNHRPINLMSFEIHDGAFLLRSTFEIRRNCCQFTSRPDESEQKRARLLSVVQIVVAKAFAILARLSPLIGERLVRRQLPGPITTSKELLAQPMVRCENNPRQLEFEEIRPSAACAILFTTSKQLVGGPAGQLICLKGCFHGYFRWLNLNKSCWRGVEFPN